MEPINVGTGEDISISNFAELISKVTGFKGDILYDAKMPDGMMEKRLDVTKINKIGWQASIKLSDGLTSTYNWALANGIL